MCWAWGFPPLENGALHEERRQAPVLLGAPHVLRQIFRHILRHVLHVLVLHVSPKGSGQSARKMPRKPSLGLTDAPTAGFERSKSAYEEAVRVDLKGCARDQPCAPKRSVRAARVCLGVSRRWKMARAPKNTVKLPSFSAPHTSSATSSAASCATSFTCSVGGGARVLGLGFPAAGRFQ